VATCNNICMISVVQHFVISLRCGQCDVVLGCFTPINGNGEFAEGDNLDSKKVGKKIMTREGMREGFKEGREENHDEG
jgi:hypothetical protein